MATAPMLLQCTTMEEPHQRGPHKAQELLKEDTLLLELQRSL